MEPLSEKTHMVRPPPIAEFVSLRGQTPQICIFLKRKPYLSSFAPHLQNNITKDFDLTKLIRVGVQAKAEQI